MTALASSSPERCRTAQWRVQEYSCGFERPHGGGWSDVRGRVVGPDDGAVTIVLGGISADRRLIEDEDGPGWWPGVAEVGGALDPTRRRLVSMDFLDDAAEPFPTVDDQAAAVLMLADTPGIERFALVGASYGGSVGLSLAAMAPERVSRLDLLCASAGVHPMTQGLRAIQREILKLAIEAGQGARGVDIARRLAMTTYRTPEEFARRFGQEGEPGGVEAYLSARGADYARTVTPERFLSRLASMEAANPDLSAINCPVNLLAFTSDRLVPLEEVEATRAALTGCDSRLVVHDSPYGHDAFLKEAARVNAFLEGRHD